MNFFQWLAGADLKILGQCSNSEKNKITGLGTLVLIPAVLGFFSMTYAISTIVDSPALYYFTGIIWAFVILAIDRFIVATLFKSKLSNTANFLWAALARYAFAILVGIAVAHPMTLLWFDESITKAIKIETQSRIEDTEKDVITEQQNIRKKIDALEDQKNCLQRLLTAEQSGHKIEIECGYASGLPGNSKRCETIQSQIDDINAQIQEENNRIQNIMYTIQTQANEKLQSIAGNESTDYLARVKKLSELQKGGDSHIDIVQYFMILFFVFIDILPITMKIATAYGEYEAIRDSITHKTVKMREADNTAIDNYINSYVILSMATLNIEAKIKEIENLYSAVNTITGNIEKERNRYDETVQNILNDISKIQNNEIRKVYTAYFTSILHLFNETISKGEKKFLDYLKSL
jgi:hypothetical protein